MQTFGQKTPPTEQHVYDFMGITTEWLDSQDWVIKYAWFGAMRDAKYLYAVSEVNRLLDVNGNVTPL